MTYRDSTHSNIIPITGPSGRKWQLRQLVDLPPVELDNPVSIFVCATKVVRYCAVSPRIVKAPTGPDEIGYDDLTVPDFMAIFNWAMAAGKAEVK